MAKVNYQNEAKIFVDAVGGSINIDSYLHCVTRMRFNVIDKDKVKIEKIKNSSLVKGINWSKNQLQIILGTGIVEKIYAEVEDILSIQKPSAKPETLEDFKLKAKMSKEALLNKTGFLGTIQQGMKGLGDIFLPIIPAIVAAGLGLGFASLFKQIGVLKPDSHFTSIIDIITKTAFDFLIVLVCWSTVKKFGGNPVLGIIVGLMFVSPILPNKSAIALSEAWEKFKANGGTAEQWKQALNASPPLEAVSAWKIWIIPITGYQGSVLPGLFIGIIIAKTEKFLKRFIPNAVNIILTPFLTIIISFTIGLFILGPILLLVESGVLIAVKAVIGIPFGFGTALTAGVLQVIVITGCHQILQGLEMQLVIDGNVPNAAGEMTGSIFNAIWTASIISQGGAGLCVAIKSKKIDERRLNFSAAISTLFGITEPAIFGTNLPRTKPFIFGLAGGFVGGLFAGILNVRCQGMGVTVIPGLLLYTDSVKNLLGIVGVNIISFGIAFILTLLFFNESNEENKYLNGIKKIFKRAKPI